MQQEKQTGFHEWGVSWVARSPRKEESWPAKLTTPVPLRPVSSESSLDLCQPRTGHGRQHAVHRGAAVRIVLAPEPAAVRRDDGFGDGQAESEAIGLRRHERLEEPIHQRRRNAGPRIADD